MKKEAFKKWNENSIFYKKLWVIIINMVMLEIIKEKQYM